MNIGAGIGVGFQEQHSKAFRYSGSEACQNGSDVTPIIKIPGGTFSASPAGLSINSSTGVIDVSASTVGSYTITYSIGPTIDTMNIVAADDSSFSYSASSFRQNASNPAPTITGISGGTFSAPTGIIFIDSGTNTNSSNGIINLSASTIGGPYTITYTSPGPCPTSSTFDVTVQVALSITYSAAAFCEDGGNTAAPTVVGDAGSGTFASTTGLTINSTTGVINTDTSTPDDNTPYTVTYTASTGETASTSVTIKILPTIVITPNPSLSVCDGSSATLTASGGVSYLWSTGATSAQITVNSSATYSVTGTGSNGCQNTASAAFTVNPLPTISISASSTSICAGDSVTLTASGAGAGGSYSWNDGQTTAAITVTPGATVTYYVTGTDTNGCFNNASQQITVTATDTATVQYAASSYCIMPTVPGAQNVNGYYPMYTTASAANAYSNDGQSHSHYLSGQTYYMPGASAASTPGVVLFHGTYATSTDQPTVTGATGGTFTKHAGSGTLSINSSTGVINLQASDAGTYTVRYTSAGTCSVTVDNTITVKPLDQTTFAYSGTSFPKVGTASVTSAPGTSGGTYSATPGLSINSSTGVIDLANSTIGTYKIFYQTAGSSTTCANNGIIENFGVTAAALTLLDNNAAMNINGVDQYIMSSGSNSSTDITISFWIKISETPTLSFGGLIAGQSGTTADYTGGFSISNNAGMFLGRNGGFGEYRIPWSAVVDGAWHHVVFTRTNTNLYGYVDGASAGSQISSPSATVSNFDNIWIGCRSYNGTPTTYLSKPFSIDEVAIFNKDLSLSEVGLIYDATNDNPGKTGDLFTGGLGSSLVYWNRMGDS